MKMQENLSFAEVAYRNKVQEDGFSDPIQKIVEINRFNAPHRHDETLFLFIQSGLLTVETPEGRVEGHPGKTITVAGGLEHTELAGPEGATILVSKR
jgi:hypothetical protein